MSEPSRTPEPPDDLAQRARALEEGTYMRPPRPRASMGRLVLLALASIIVTGLLFRAVVELLRAVMAP
jgi:hypothetical protein